MPLPRLSTVATVLVIATALLAVAEGGRDDQLAPDFVLQDDDYNLVSHITSKYECSSMQGPMYVCGGSFELRMRSL